MVSKNSRVSVTIRVFFVIGCLAGNMVQVFQISNNYFQYEMVSKFSIFFPEELTNFPSFTLCVNIIDIFKWNLLANTTGSPIDQDSLSEYFKDTLSKFFNGNPSEYLNDTKRFIY